MVHKKKQGNHALLRSTLYNPKKPNENNLHEWRKT